MYIWVAFSLTFVVVVKYYTAMEMRKLERRLETVKDDLHRVKEQLVAAQERQQEVQQEEENFEERVRRMKEVMEDLQMRLTSSQDQDEEAKMVISDTMPDSRPF